MGSESIFLEGISAVPYGGFISYIGGGSSGESYWLLMQGQ